MDYSKKISIITVCFNSEKTIALTLKSVNEQTYPNIEHVIVDGASRDNTLKLIKEFDAVKPRVILSEPDKGIYDAMNKGISLASGSYIQFLNADDYLYDKGCIEKIVPRLKQGYINSCPIYVTRSTGRVIIGSGTFQKWRTIYKLSVIPHPGCFIERSLFAELGGFDINYSIAGDADLLLRYLNSRPVNRIEQPAVEMSGGGISSTDISKSFDEFMEASINNGVPRIVAKIICKLKKLRLTLA